MHVAVFTKRTIGHESFKSNFSPKLRLISPKKKKKRKKSQLYNHEIPNSRNDRQHCSIQIPKRGGASHIWDPPRQNATNSPELRLISLVPPQKGQARLTARIPRGQDFDWFQNRRTDGSGSAMVNDADYSRVGGGGGGGGAWLVADMSVYVSVPAARDHVALSLYDVDVERSVPPTPAVGRRGTFLRRAVAERREMPRCAPDETQLKPDLRYNCNWG